MRPKCCFKMPGEKLTLAPQLHQAAGEKLEDGVAPISTNTMDASTSKCACGLWHHTGGGKWGGQSWEHALGNGRSGSGCGSSRCSTMAAHRPGQNKKGSELPLAVQGPGCCHDARILKQVFKSPVVSHWIVGNNILNLIFVLNCGFPTCCSVSTFCAPYRSGLTICK